MMIIIIKIKKRRGKIINNKNNSTQAWLDFKEILPNGVIKTNDKYIKIIKIIPINFNLKSEMEKNSILNSYKIFLKTINSDLQIIVQSKKEDLSKHISVLEFQKNNENNKIKNISQNYIEYIKELNKRKKSSTKNYYIIIKSNKYNNDPDNYENIANNELLEKYLKIKDCLSRCGNTILEVNTKKEIVDILFSFLNSQKFIFE